MSFTFHKIKDHWYLYLDKNTTKETLVFHEKLTIMLNNRHRRNTHCYQNLEDEINKGDFLNAITHPEILKTKWLVSALELIDKKGAIHVNQVGGIKPFNDNDVIDKIESDKMEFPIVKKDGGAREERITIKNWQNGTHFYLISNCNRVFCDKYNTLQRAKEEAKKYVTEDRIFVEYTPESKE